jgi:methylmalonyl-CoA/ethylmalonyl-CoA epimerase
MIFHHIGFLTTNIRDSLSEFKMLNYKKEKKLFVDNIFNVKIQFIRSNKNIIELIKPNKSNKGLMKMLKDKNYAYHFAYKVKNIDNEIIKLEKSFKLIVKPTRAIAFNNKKVSFLKTRSGFIIELIEK